MPTTEDLIRQEAAKQGVPPDLALAIADAESGLNPGTKPGRKLPSGEQAVGLFQILPSTAKTLGINANDPYENLTGGIRYIKDLLDKHQGDRDKVIAEYGGVKTDTTYVPNVLGRLSKFGGVDTRQATAPPSFATAGMGAQSTPTEAAPAAPEPGLLRSMAEAVNPMTPGGRENLVAAGGALALGAATGGLGDVAGVLPWVIRAAGPILGAATAGAGEAAVEQTLGVEGAADPTTAGLRQGAYEAGGQALMGAGRRILGGVLATKVGRAASERLEENLTAARRGGIAAAERVRGHITDAVNQVRTMASAASEAIRGRVPLPSVAPAARFAMSERLAAKDVENAGSLRAMEEVYDNLLAQPPSPSGTATAVRAAVGPGSPAKAAFDAAGARVGEAAASGPALPIAPVKDAIAEMAAQHRPTEIFGTTEPATIGFQGAVTPSVVPITARPAAMATGQRVSIDEYRALLQQAAKTKSLSDLPGILGRVQNIQEETLPFDVVHQIKRLLDESVNWDKTARRHMEQITKGTRITLRELMADANHEPYETATAAYAALIPLYRRGIGKQVIRNAVDNPDALARTLDPKKPAQAQALRELLLTQTAAGGQPQVGRAAWDAVRSNLFYQKLLKGGVDGLAERTHAFFAEYPEFARVVLDDQPSRVVVSNMDRLGNAYTLAKEQLKDIGMQAKAGEQAARTAGSKELRATREASRSEVNAIKDQQRALQRSSLQTHTFGGMMSDVLRAGALGPGSRWGALSLVRLMSGPKASEIAHWAVYSPRNTQRLVAVLQSRVPDRVAADVIRDLSTALDLKTTPSK